MNKKSIIILTVIVTIIFLFSQPLLANNVYPNIPVISLCKITFRSQLDIDYIVSNEYSCYTRRIPKQQDWKDCFKGESLKSIDAGSNSSWSNMSPNEIGSCIAETSYVKNVDNCAKLPIGNTRKSCESRLIAIKKVDD